MESKNNHIKVYLDQYMEVKTPGFAILIKGKWGSGKTHFIKNWREARMDKKEILYVSLYGIEHISQIDSQLLMSNFTELEGRWEKIGGKISVGVNTVSQFLKGYIEKKIDIPLPELSFGDIITNIEFKEKVVIFDDLERSSLELDVILGYINTFVEHKEARIIIIGDETKITDPKIKAIKEKTIGKTLHFEAEFDNIVDILINVADTEVQNILKRNKLSIGEIFYSSTLNNLRILKQSLYEFERFFLLLPKDLKSILEFQDNILSLFLILSFEIHSGNITNITEDLPSILKIDIGEILGTSDKVSPLKKSIREKYLGFDSLIRTILNIEIWLEFFDKNLISDELLQKEVAESLYLDHTPDWLKLWYYRNLEDGEFDPLVKKVFDSLSEGKLENIYEIMHVTSIFIYFSEIGLSAIKKGDILAVGKRELDRLAYQLNPNYDKSNRIKLEGALGHGYHGTALDKNKELLEHLQKIAEEQKIESYNEEGTELLSLYKAGKIREAHELLYNRNYNQPILAYIKAKDFLDAFDLVKNEKKILILEGIEGRYKNPSREDLNEQKFFDDLLPLIEEKIGSSKKNISTLYYEKLGQITQEIIKKIRVVEKE